MSTRATYTIKTPNSLVSRVCFYIHHDGYPKGAAAYFRAALERWVERCSQDIPEDADLAASFFRANLNARLTQSPTLHADTEYHYECLPHLNIIRAYRWVDEENGSRRRKLIQKSSIEDFVNHYADEGGARFRKGVFTLRWSRIDM